MPLHCRLAPAGYLPVAARRTDARVPGAALFRAGGWPPPDDPAEPVRPPRSPAATFWSWLAVALLIASLILPFSLAGLIDLVRWLRR